jgi:hypothetical protein
MDDLVSRLRDLRCRLGGVQPANDYHDNLATTLVSYFEDGEGDVDDCGWTDKAVARMDEMLDAIHAHYAAPIREMADRIAALEAENARLRDALARCPPYRHAEGLEAFKDSVDAWWRLWARPALSSEKEADNA